jgi:hypothetical protein
LRKTPNRHWHIDLDENKDGKLELSIPNGLRMPLGNFELVLV